MASIRLLGQLFALYDRIPGADLTTRTALEAALGRVREVVAHAVAYGLSKPNERGK